MASGTHSAEEKDVKEVSKKPRGKGIILALLLIAAAGGGGAAAGAFGFLDPVLGPLLKSDHASVPVESHGAPAGNGHAPAEPVAFLALDPILVPVTLSDRRATLRLTAHLEVAAERKAEGEAVVPRVLNIFNAYLRATEGAVLADPDRFEQVRAELLRRARLVAGDTVLRDLLVQELVLL